MLYKDWAPSMFDRKGASLPERQDWIIAPILLTRDSDRKEHRKFYTVLRKLGNESDVVEVHRFRHWGCGWFHIILAAPGTKQAAKLERWEQRLKESSGRADTGADRARPD